jgi:hypothetical protein
MNRNPYAGAWPAAMGLALAALSPTLARADAASDIATLRNEISAIRSDYEARLQALEAKLRTAEAQSAAAAAAPPPVAQPVAAAPATAAAGANAFNPALSLILSGQYSSSTRDPATYRIGGVALPPGAEIGPGTRSFSLGESELGLAANIDPWWRGAANISFHGDDTVSVEEAFVETTALGQGFTVKAGRFLSGIGYLNSQHAHTWDFVDSPLAYQALLGSQFGDDGVQLRWLAPTDQFLEFGLELGRGHGYPGSDMSRNGPGSAALTVHTGGDVGESSTWRLGASMLRTVASGQGLELPNSDGSFTEARFDGHTRVAVIDGVWKWAPNGNATRTNFKLQGEWLRSTRSGTLDGGPLPPGMTTSGWYLQGVYQFMPGWRVGLRTERLTTDGQPERPRKNSLMVDWSASEFSRIRAQLADDHARPGGPSDMQFTLQYQMSLGAHGAHSY